MNRMFFDKVARFLCFVVGVGALLTTGCASFKKSTPLGQDKWDWNLFSDSKPDPVESPLYASSSKKKSSWLPSWKSPWPSKKTSSSYSRNNGTTWDRMKKSSKRFWAKTAEVLDPYPDPKPESSTPPKKASGFSSWFKREEPKKIETVQDWLDQPRVGT
jgi:hypothetical protein